MAAFANSNGGTIFIDVADVGSTRDFQGPMWPASKDGRLNLAGVLLFAEQPEWIVPQFGWEAMYAYNNEDFGPGSMLCRA